MVLADLRGEADAFLAEDQHRALRVVDAPILPRRFGAEEERLAKLVETRLEFVPRVPHYGVHPGPVVEAGPAHLPLAEEEPERPHEVEPRPGGEAGAAGVAGVPVNLRLDQDDVEISIHERRSLYREPGNDSPPPHVYNGMVIAIE